MKNTTPPPWGRTMGNYFENMVYYARLAILPSMTIRSNNMQQMLLPQMEEKEKPRLSNNDRQQIETGLNAKHSTYGIAKDLGRPPKTIMREIIARAVEELKGCVGRINNRCVHSHDCQKRNDACKTCIRAHRSFLCRLCRQCNSNCPDFIEQKCEKLEKPPFVCNGCNEKNRCPLRKNVYHADVAQKNYETLLSESRKGANITEEELNSMDELIYRLTENGQSIHAAVVNNPDEIPVSEKTIYRYIDGGLLKTKNGDLPRKCKLSPRKVKSVEHKVDTKCRINRTFADYHNFMDAHPGSPVIEMDTVEGVKGGKVLLSLMFMPYSFMLAFLLDSKTSANVIAMFRLIRDKLIGRFGKDEGLALMSELFPVILTDNGTEFSNPSAIEFDHEGNKITVLFYCDPCASWQKSHCERNHEGIRLILPKGNHYLLPTSFNDLTQADVDLMMSHVNSYIRPVLGDKAPYDLFTQRFGTEIAELFGIKRIPANEIVLKPKLLGIEQKVRPWVNENQMRKA